MFSKSENVADTPIRVGVSSCLLGEKVRYDAGDKRDSFVADVLPRYFELIPVCPEVAIGMGVPRPPIHLTGDPRCPRAVGVAQPERDFTAPLAAYGAKMAQALGPISGYVFKSKSPSCGMQRVKVHPLDGGRPVKQGRGIYAAELMRRLPLLPTEDESRLQDPELRESFLSRVHAYRRWQDLLREGVTAPRLLEFHTRHKLILMAHSKERLRELGRLVAVVGSEPIEQLAARYIALFMQALSCRPTRRRHADVLFHLMGYLKRQLGGMDKAELVEAIEDYRQGRAPLIVPVTLLRHHFRRHPQEYVSKQLYLDRSYTDLHLHNAI